MVYWDGRNFVRYCLRPGLILGELLKFWGSGTQDLYCVGRSGTIIYFDGSTWRAVESGTTLPINDVWGSRHSTTGQLEVLCVASDQFHGTQSSLLRLEGTTVVPAPSTGLPWSLAT